MIRYFTNPFHTLTVVVMLGISVFPNVINAQPGNAVLIQGFNWESHKYGWYNVLNNNAAAIQAGKFNGIWFPPPSDANSDQGYLPRQLNKLDSKYGTQAALVSLISNYKSKNIKVIADIVINHRVGTTGWGDFTNPTWGCNSVVKGDEWTGACSGNFDSGDGYSSARDLDHNNATVKTDLINWMKWLKNTIGFEGWRYDYVKGYHGSHTKNYNDNTLPWISIGELWTDLDLNNTAAHRQRLIDWINATGGTSTAFDFTTKGVLQRAVGFNEYGRLSSNGQAPGLIGAMASKSVTFIDNHDTGSTQAHWPFPTDNDKVLQGYAYILTHPGIPMVFWDHYFDWGTTYRTKIQDLINVRKSYGITSTSSLSIKRAETGLYAAVIGGNVAVKLGPTAWSPGTGWTLRTSHTNWAVWTYGTAVARLGEDEVEAGDIFKSTVSLEQNYPNPVDGGTTTIAFTITKKQNASLRLFNSMGVEVAELANDEFSEGRHEITVNLSQFKTGVYTYKLVTGEQSLTKRLLVK